MCTRVIPLILLPIKIDQISTIGCLVDNTPTKSMYSQYNGYHGDVLVVIDGPDYT